MRTGLVSGDRHLSLAAMQEQVLRAVSGFEALGIGARDAVAVLLRNDLPFLVTIYAANRLGAYAVPINWHFKGPEVAYILRDCGAKALVVHAHILADEGLVASRGLTKPSCKLGGVLGCCDSVDDRAIAFNHCNFSVRC